MRKPPAAKDRLLSTARDLFWRIGYGPVSVRDIAARAEADPALINRYFGGKEGLFFAAIDGAFDWPEVFDDPRADLTEGAINAVNGPNGHSSFFHLILRNSHDPDVGDGLQRAVASELRPKLVAKIGGPFAEDRADLFLAVVLGVVACADGLQAETLKDPAKRADRLREAGRNALRFIG